ncbi:MAG: MBL fold metallo-hydrolase [Edaphobacter sp.]
MLSRIVPFGRSWSFVIALSLCLPSACSGSVGAKGLDIYIVDVEGGGATLIITPARQAVLIDGGWSTPDHRDSKRILAVLKGASIDHLDYVIVSHYHPDHLGGIVELASQIPVTEFLDRGSMATPQPYVSPALYAEYMEIAGKRRRAMKLGERIRLRAQPGTPAPSLLVLASAGRTMQATTRKSNPSCSAAHAGPVDNGENSYSVAVLLEYGSFHYLDAADLTWPKEAQLVCPSNQIGHVNVYQVDHHGKNTSNNPVLLASIHADAAVMNNGATKGGDASVVAELKKVLAPTDIFQLHRNIKTGTAGNIAESNIANPAPPDGGFGFLVHVDASGKSYEIINERTAEVHKYASVRQGEGRPSHRNVN